MIYLFLADGFEETEAIVPLDIALRAGVQIKTVGVGKKTVTGSHGITVTADITTDELDVSLGGFGVVLPGGMPGTTNLAADSTVNAAIDCAASEGKLLAAICAAPSILGQKGKLCGKNATCYPGWEEKLIDANYTAQPVTVDGNIITAWGAGAAINFGFAIVEFLCGADKARELEKTFKCVQ